MPRCRRTQRYRHRPWTNDVGTDHGGGTGGVAGACHRVSAGSGVDAVQRVACGGAWHGVDARRRLGAGREVGTGQGVRAGRRVKSGHAGGACNGLARFERSKQMIMEAPHDMAEARVSAQVMR